MRTASRLLAAPFAGAAFLLVLATSLPIQLTSAWAADEPASLASTAAPGATVSITQGDGGDMSRDEPVVQIAPQPDAPTSDEAPAAAEDAAATRDAAGPAAASLAPISGGASPDAILADLNAQRTASGLAPFAGHGGLSGVAQQWSATQASTASMAHNPAFAAQTNAAGCGGATENVASAQGSISPVAAWMASPPHRANILSSATHLGVGAATSTNGITYYTLNFATC